MLDLSEGKLTLWVKKLPADIRGILDMSAYSNEAEPLVIALRVATPTEVPDLLRTHDENSIKALGRVGRLRLMAWLSDSLMTDENAIDPSPLFRELLGEEDEGEGGGQRSAVSTIFYEDFLAFSKIMGLRSAHAVFTNDMVDVALGAAREASRELVAARGGI
jgi:hypothetical protein